LLERAQDPSNLNTMSDAGIHVWIADAYLTIGSVADAVGSAERALQIARRGGERASEAWALRLQGEIALKGGQPDAAADLFRGALTAADALGMRWLQLRCHRGLSDAMRASRRQMEADAESAAAVALHQELGLSGAFPESFASQ
jgi:tetratricopeptide (TPR) repeat protein